MMEESMNRTQTWILVLLLIAILECSCTNPNEATDPNVTVWTKKDSPIIVDSLVHVKAGETLRIEKGVTVLLKSSVLPLYYTNESENKSDIDSLKFLFSINDPHVGLIRIDGNFEACGTDSEPIVFTRNGNGYSGGIYADTCSVISLNYCHISYMGGMIKESADYFIETTFFLNGSSGAITGCVIDKNLGRAITLYNSDHTIRGNRFETDTGFTIKNSSPVIDNNVFIDGFMAFFCSENSNPYIINNTIANYVEGITVFTFKQFGGNPIIMNNIFWELDSHYLTKGANSVYTFEYNLIVQKGITSTTIKGHNWASENPHFADEDNENYMLLADSPMIDVGCTEIEGYEFPEYDFYGNKRIFGGKVDVGASEFIR